jgi:hypothetical protein
LGWGELLRPQHSLAAATSCMSDVGRAVMRPRAGGRSGRSGPLQVGPTVEQPRAGRLPRTLGAVFSLQTAKPHEWHGESGVAEAESEETTISCRVGRQADLGPHHRASGRNSGTSRGETHCGGGVSQSRCAGVAERRQNGLGAGQRAGGQGCTCDVARGRARSSGSSWSSWSSSSRRPSTPACATPASRQTPALWPSSVPLISLSTRALATLQRRCEGAISKRAAGEEARASRHRREPASHAKVARWQPHRIANYRTRNPSTSIRFARRYSRRPATAFFERCWSHLAHLAHRPLPTSSSEAAGP